MKGSLKRKMTSLLDDKRGDLFQLPVNLLMAFIVITFLVALVPGLMQMSTLAQQSNYLNCPGYTSPTNPVLSYNATLAGYGYTSSIGCLAITMYVPYIVLGVLIGLVALIFYGRSMGGGGIAGQAQPGYY